MPTSLRSEMVHSIRRVRNYWLTGGYQIDIEFDGGVHRQVDLEPILRDPLFGPLRDPEFFRQVRLDSEVGTLVWPNGADFDPATLYDWPEVKNTMAQMARTWSDEGET